MLVTTLLNQLRRTLPLKLGRLSDARGVTTVEYAIMLVLIAIAVAGSAPGLRDAVVNTFNLTASTLANASAGS